MNGEDVKRAILIVQQAMTAFAKQAIVEICHQEGLNIETFQETELLVNITKQLLNGLPWQTSIHCHRLDLLLEFKHQDVAGCSESCLLEE